MKSLLLLFYRLDPVWILLLAYLATLGFRSCWNIWGNRPWFRPLCGGLLLVWCYILVHQTILYRMIGSCAVRHLMPLQFLREVYVTGNLELFRSMFMNCALFYPAGILLTVLAPRSWPRRRTAAAVCLALLLVSMAVEGFQLHYAIGRAETDDVLFNTLGAWLGTRPLLFSKN